MTMTTRHPARVVTWQPPREEIRAARADGFVSCTECGHDIEIHEDEPCPICGCAQILTAAQVRDLCAAYGVPLDGDEDA